MKNFILNRLWIMFLAGFLLGALVFFPTNQIKEKIFASILKSTGTQLQAESMSFGTGLGLGVSKGGVFALRFSKLRAQMGATVVDCDKAVVSPHLWTFLIGQAVAGLSCESERMGAVVARASLKPFWRPETCSVDANFKGFNLSAFAGALQAYPIRGLLYGDLAVQDASLQARGLPPLSWKLSMQNVVLPSVSSDFVSLPEIPLGTLDTTGSLKGAKLVMAPFMMGNSASPLSADLDINLGLDSTMLPTSGEIKGSLRADPKWEASIKDTLDLTLLFGTPNETGTRRFRKPLQGSPFSLLSPPLPY